MKVFGVTGKPAAGKSVVSEMLAEYLDAPRVEMGDIVTERVAEYLGVGADELTSNQKGNAATDLREEYGSTVFVDATVEAVRSLDSPVCVVSGVRTLEEVEVFEDAFDFELVLVSAPFETRYERFTSRGREDEAEYSREQFQARIERELAWGLEDILSTEVYDWEVVNDDSLDVVRRKIKKSVSS